MLLLEKANKNLHKINNKKKKANQSGVNWFSGTKL